MGYATDAILKKVIFLFKKNKKTEVKMLYVLNSLSPSMFDKKATVSIEEINLQMATYILKSQEFVSAIGHTGTAQLIETLTGVPVNANRIAIRLTQGDSAIIFTLSFRAEEGRVYNAEEMQLFYNEGKVKIYKLDVL